MDSTPSTAAPAPGRLAPLDRMRGLVMALMMLDHVSLLFNRERWSEDSYGMNSAGAPMFLEPGDPWDFLTRWITHLCAPTFVFLAGTALALSVAARLDRGASAWSVDRHLLVRGVILIALEPWMSLAARFPVFQVLYAIGAALVCMVLLRRLPSWALVTLALLWIGAGEWITEAGGWKPDVVPGRPPLAAPLPGLLFVNGLILLPVTLPSFLWMPETPVMYSLYPLVPWLAIMMLGWAFGRWLVARRADGDLAHGASRLLARAGALALVVFVVQRSFDGYGNLWLPRGDDTAWRWLQVSKYPPSLAFYTLELGLMALLLAGIFRSPFGGRGVNGPLLVFGQVALFFYVIHLHLLALVRALAFDASAGQPFDRGTTWGATAFALLALYPVCRAYRSLKRKHSDGPLRFL